jgi:hypothetical protein
MEEIQQQMEPVHQRMEEVHRRLERAIEGELRSVLEEHLAELGLTRGALDRISERVRRAVDVRLDDDRLRLRASASELREILAEETGVEPTHPAIEETVQALLDLDTSLG